MRLADLFIPATDEPFTITATTSPAPVPKPSPAESLVSAIAVAALVAVLEQKKVGSVAAPGLKYEASAQAQGGALPQGSITRGISARAFRVFALPGALGVVMRGLQSITPAAKNFPGVKAQLREVQVWFTHN